MADGCQSLVRIILTQQQTEFRTAGHHSVRFSGAFVYDIVNENADITVGTFQHHRFLAFDIMHRIDAADETLRRRFFVTAGTVELTRGEQTGEILEFQRQFQLSRIDTVIFDGIGKTGDFAVFQTRNGSVHGDLYIFRQGRTHPLNIHFFCIFPFGFYEDLMSFLIGKTHDLIFDGRAITRAGTFDDTAEHGRTVQVVTDDLVCFFVSIGQVAQCLRFFDIFGFIFEGERYDILVTILGLHFVQIQRVSVHSGRGTCFETEQVYAHFFQSGGKFCGRHQVVGAAFCNVFPCQTAGFHVCAHTQHNSLTLVNRTGRRYHAADLAVLHEDIHDLCLFDF